MMYQRPDVPGITWRREDVGYHGARTREYVVPGRRVVAGRWPAARPEECKDESGSGEWIAHGQLLVCRGCGLDCT